VSLISAEALACATHQLVTSLSSIASVGDPRPIAFATSFGAEDMVLLNVIASYRLPISVFTLDTGRLPAETLNLMTRAAQRYARDGIQIDVIRPDENAVSEYVSAHGVNAFYETVALRKSCCQIRKVEPLCRALAGKRAWITGLRREQAASRATIAFEEHDVAHGIAKFNPLLDWTEALVWAYLHTHAVPYNALHDRGYSSIGCEPCTRAIKLGEDIRAGRWWWEQNAGQKECGLHVAEAAPLASNIALKV
jgi:phosphoadenosine phosphosulfate reductase